MAKVNTDEWQSGFMTMTLVTVVLINLNAAIFQGKFIFKMYTDILHKIDLKYNHFPIYSFVIEMA